MSKIGLYFGSFNPVHIGHLAIAGYMKEFTDIDQIWFVVSPQNPLKKKEIKVSLHNCKEHEKKKLHFCGFRQSLATNVFLKIHSFIAINID